MNFLPAQLIGQGDGLAVRLGDGVVLPVPAARAERYAAMRDRAVVFGLRPEHLTDIPAEGRPGFAPLTPVADVVEPMGAETMVHIRIDGTPICARCVPSTAASPGMPLPLWADMSQMHLIDPESSRVV